jgi:hypothetical protein
MLRPNDKAAASCGVNNRSGESYQAHLMDQSISPPFLLDD